MRVKIYCWGRNPATDDVLSAMGRVDAFMLNTDGDETAWLIWAPTIPYLITLLNHEALHAVIMRLGLGWDVSRSLDELSNVNRWSIRGDTGGL